MSSCICRHEYIHKAIAYIHSSVILIQIAFIVVLNSIYYYNLKISLSIFCGPGLTVC
jgi:hypothetical protein